MQGQPYVWYRPAIDNIVNSKNNGEDDGYNILKVLSVNMHSRFQYTSRKWRWVSYIILISIQMKKPWLCFTRLSRTRNYIIYTEEQGRPVPKVGECEFKVFLCRLKQLKTIFSYIRMHVLFHIFRVPITQVIVEK